MTDHVHARIENQIGILTLTRAAALNALSLPMVRALMQTLLSWRDDDNVRAVVIHSDNPKAFCAGGDLRFLYAMALATPQGGSALLEDFFTEEYALNYLTHTYPKPYIALMDGIVMGGGMGISQSGPACRLRIVTERTKMAMPEVNIGIFPDVGGSHFLSRARGHIGRYLAATGATIGAADALYADLADLYIPSAQLAQLLAVITTSDAADLRSAIAEFARPFQTEAKQASALPLLDRAAIARDFAAHHPSTIITALKQADTADARDILTLMAKRSPLMMCVTLEQLRRGADMTFADCLRMERNMMRHCFERGELIEGVRALVIDKDNAPQWSAASVDAVTNEVVASYFAPVWPSHAHPLRSLQ